MHNYLISIIILLFFILVGKPTQAKTRLTPAQQKEKVFLHSDRDIYVAGEHLFFRMQVASPLSVSKNTSRIAYLVLRNAQSSNIIELAVQLDDKGAYSALILPDTLSSGHYELVAFTNHMRNFGEEGFFRKQIFVANRFDNKISLIEKFNEGYQSIPLAFFPEGGLLINGVSSKVAVVTGHSGIPAGGSAWLADSKEDTLQRVNFDHPGFTVFTVTPEPQESYFLVMENGNRFALPQAVQQGSGMSITEQQGQLDIQLHPAFDVFGTYSLEAHSPGHISKLRMVSLHKQPLLLSFSSDELPYGVVNFLLKDEKGNIVCQRMWYRKPQTSLEVELTGTHPPARRQQVPFRVTSNEMDPLPVSVAVVQRGLCFEPHQKIINQLLLKQQDLADYQQLAEQASLSSMKVAINDLLMVVAAGNQLWEYHKPQEDLVHIQEMQGFNLSGKLVDAQTNQGSADAVIYLSSPDTLLNFNYATTLEDGSFYFLLDEYYHGKEMILQVADPLLVATTRIQVLDRFDLKQPFTPGVFEQVNDHLQAIADLQKILSVQKHYGMRAEVISNSPDLPVRVPRPLFYTANQVVVPAKYVALDNFREMTREIIFSLRIRSNADGSYSSAMVNARQGSYFNEAPMFFLDAVPVHDIRQIMNISSNELQRIDVHDIPWIFEDLIFDGIVSLVSRNSKHQELELPASAARVYAPVYASRLVLQHKAYQGNHPENLIPDLRPLLAWIPELMSGPQQPAESSFICGDIKGDFIIIVNGINSQGIPVAHYLSFVVQ